MNFLPTRTAFARHCYGLKVVRNRNSFTKARESSDGRQFETSQRIAIDGPAVADFDDSISNYMHDIDAIDVFATKARTVELYLVTYRNRAC